jgi:hypothetical protein
MRVSKGLLFIAIAAVLSSMVIAQSTPSTPKPTTPALPGFKPAKSVASRAAQKAAMDEAAKKAAEEIARSAPVITGEIMDKMVPEGSQLVDGNQKGEFFIVPKDGEMPKIETAQTVAVTKAMEEAEQMVNNITVPKLEAALEESTHAIGATAQTSKVMTHAVNPSLMLAENTIKTPTIQLVEPAPVSDAASQPSKPKSKKILVAHNDDSSAKPTPKHQTEIKKPRHNSKSLHQRAGKLKKMMVHNSPPKAAPKKATKKVVARASSTFKPVPKLMSELMDKKTKTKAVKSKHPRILTRQKAKRVTLANHVVFKVKRFADIR